MLSKLIYVGDPMCSWCWGFAPEIEALADEHPVEAIVGGLRPGPSAQPMTARSADAYRGYWRAVAERTGQPFDYAFLDDADGWVYDTEPAAIAVTQIRELNEPETLGYFTTVQHAFYAEGRDVTDFDVLTELTSGLDVDTEAFRASLDEPESKKRAWADFSQARRWGITGFPTLVGELADDRLALLAQGWTPASVIRQRISSLDEGVA